MENAELLISEIEKLLEEAEDSNLVALAGEKSATERVFLSGRADALSKIKDAIDRVVYSVAA